LPHRRLRVLKPREEKAKEVPKEIQTAPRRRNPLKTRFLYEFGSFQLDPAEHLLQRAGEPVPLAPKAFDLLVYLVEHRGRLVTLVTKDQLLTALWPESFVEEANLTVCVSALRKALGEKRGADQYIDTVPKKGYRFIATVAEDEEPAAAIPIELAAAASPVAGQSGVVSVERSQVGSTLVTQPTVETQLAGSDTPPLAPDAIIISNHRSRRIFILALATICLVAAIAVPLVLLRFRRSDAQPKPKTLAVLPFQNLRHDPAADFLGFSLADSIINRLGYVTALNVRPSYAVQKYRDEVPDLQQVARTLSVDTLLTGSFIREGDDLRVGYQVIDPANNRLLRQGTVDVKYENLLAVQDEVSGQVINILSLTLSPSESSLLKGQQQPIPPEAYEYYLRGVDLYSRNDFPLAIKMLERSAELYPGYALTWAHLGRSYTASGSFNFGGAELYRKAQTAYEKALTLQPDLLLARIYMANLLTDTGNPEQAVPLLREALRLNSNLAEAHWELSYAYRHGGMLQESVAEAGRARELDPVVKLNSSTMNGYLYLGEYAAFLRSLPPSGDSAFVEFYRGFAQYHVSPTEETARLLDRAYQLDPSMLQTQVGKALAHHLRHEDGRGLALLGAAEAQVAHRAVHDAEAIYKIAQAYSELGDTASAIRLFRQSVENGFFPDRYFVRDPLMANARQTPGFEPIVRIASQRSEAFRKQFS
jgi:DNA-binding winged helix-turn-helix (wHTH) protein/TolB-like protein